MTPLILITGFLGSGKTSLLRRVLPELKDAGMRPHVILNDYANAAVDSATLRDLAQDIIPITGSCVCCDSMEDLLEELEDLPLGGRDVVLVETNGTTDPLPLLERLLVLPLGRRFPVIWQVNLVDASRWGQRMNCELEKMQARTASHVLFTWLDQAGDAQCFRVQEEIRRLNPRAKVLAAEELVGEITQVVRGDGTGLPPTFSSVFAPVRDDRFALHPMPGKWVVKKAGALGMVPLPGKERQEKRRLHQLAHRFSAVQLEVPRKLHPLQLVAWLEAMPVNVIRAKGVVQFAGQFGGYHFFQRVEDTVSFHEMVWGPPDDLTLALVIGVDLDEGMLRREARGFFMNGKDESGRLPRDFSASVESSEGFERCTPS